MNEQMMDDLMETISEVTAPDMMSLAEAQEFYEELGSRAKTMADALRNDMRRGA
jgi:hypothetical protein